MSVTEHSTLTFTQPSWWTSGASQEISETITKYPTLMVEQRGIKLEVSAILRSRPWFRSIKNRLQEFLTLQEDWNGYGEDPIHEGAIKRAFAVLDAIVSETTPKPDVVPTSGGGVQIEWAYDDFEIEVEVLPTGPAQIIVVESPEQEDEYQAGSNSEVWGILRKTLERVGREPVV